MSEFKNTKNAWVMSLTQEELSRVLKGDLIDLDAMLETRVEREDYEEAQILKNIKEKE